MINPLKEGNVHKIKRTYQSNKKVIGIELYITVGASNPFCCMKIIRHCRKPKEKPKKCSCKVNSISLKINKNKCRGLIRRNRGHPPTNHIYYVHQVSNKCLMLLII